MCLQQGLVSFPHARGTPLHSFYFWSNLWGRHFTLPRYPTFDHTHTYACTHAHTHTHSLTHIFSSRSLVLPFDFLLRSCTLDFTNSLVHRDIHTQSCLRCLSDLFVTSFTYGNLCFRKLVWNPFNIANPFEWIRQQHFMQIWWHSLNIMSLQ